MMPLANPSAKFKGSRNTFCGNFTSDSYCGDIFSSFDRCSVQIRNTIKNLMITQKEIGRESYQGNKKTFPRKEKIITGINREL